MTFNEFYKDYYTKNHKDAEGIEWFTTLNRLNTKELADAKSKFKEYMDDFKAQVAQWTEKRGLTKVNANQIIKGLPLGKVANED